MGIGFMDILLVLVSFAMPVQSYIAHISGAAKYS